jgi:hypothetical protein
MAANSSRQALAQDPLAQEALAQAIIALDSASWTGQAMALRLISRNICDAVDARVHEITLDMTKGAHALPAWRLLRKLTSLKHLTVNFPNRPTTFDALDIAGMVSCAASATNSVESLGLTNVELCVYVERQHVAIIAGALKALKSLSIAVNGDAYYERWMELSEDSDAGIKPAFALGALEPLSARLERFELTNMFIDDMRCMLSDMVDPMGIKPLAFHMLRKLAMRDCAFFTRSLFGELVAIASDVPLLEVADFELYGKDDGQHEVINNVGHIPSMTRKIALAFAQGCRRLRVLKICLRGDIFSLVERKWDGWDEAVDTRFAALIDAFPEMPALSVLDVSSVEVIDGYHMIDNDYEVDDQPIAADLGVAPGLTATLKLRFPKLERLTCNNAFIGARFIGPVLQIKNSADGTSSIATSFWLPTFVLAEQDKLKNVSVCIDDSLSPADFGALSDALALASGRVDLCIVFKVHHDVASVLCAASRIPNLATLSLVGRRSSLPHSAFEDLPAFGSLETLRLCDFKDVTMAHVMQLAQIRAPRLSTVHWQCAFTAGTNMVEAATAIVVALAVRQGPSMTLTVEWSSDLWIRVSDAYKRIMSTMGPPMNAQLQVQSSCSWRGW